jgi:hypothetical protein
MTNWFEVYYSFLSGCKEHNQHDLPESGWEWNHTLPQCLFGDTPVGQWLTKEQHAVATALQTLAFQKSCLFGSHLILLPPKLKELVDPYWRKRQGERGKIAAGRGAATCKRLKKGAMFRTPEQMTLDGRKGASVQSFEHRSLAGKKGSASTNAQLWQNTHPDFESIVLNPGTLSKWQKARGIDFKNKQFRVRRYDLETTTTSSTKQS